MSIFQITKEFGYSRILNCKYHVPTPWLFTTQDGLKHNSNQIHQIIVTKNGLINLNSTNLTNYFQENIFDSYLDFIPNWSILTPRLIPATNTLHESFIYELNLFLDRLDRLELPKVFGLVHDPINSSECYLKQLLQFKPSIIALKLPPVDRISPRKLIPLVLNARKKIPNNIAIYLPGGAQLGFQSLLVGLGIDIFDDTVAYRAASEDRIFLDGFVKKVDPSHSYKETINQNLTEINHDFKGVILNLKDNTLWTRIARDMHAHPNVASIVNLLGNDYLNHLDFSRYPRNAHNLLQFTGDEGLYHPEVIAYQNRLLERYEFPKNTRLVILFPCSAKKPYFHSRSHKLFEKAINLGAKRNRHVISVCSLTSPLGVVPREIETIYPAKNYDIPVTGKWSDEETNQTMEMLKKILDQLPSFVGIIAHVSEGYREVIDLIQLERKLFAAWIGSSPTSHDALNQLSSSITNYFSELSDQSIDPLNEKKSIFQAKKEISAIIKFTHGKTVDINLENIKIIGRPPRPLQIQKNGIHWITWDSLHGLVRLTPNAAKEIAHCTNNWVIVNTDNLKGSTLYAVGVQDASKMISPGEEIIIFNPDQTRIIGIGESLISGLSMINVDFGPVAKIRKKCQITVKKIMREN